MARQTTYSYSAHGRLLHGTYIRMVRPATIYVHYLSFLSPCPETDREDCAWKCHLLLLAAHHIITFPTQVWRNLR